MEESQGKSYYCGICQGLTTNKRHGKVISGESARPFVSTLQDFVKEHFPRQCLEDYIKLLPISHSYICNHCQERTSKYKMLKDEIKQLTQELNTDISKLLGSVQTSSTHGDDPSTPKRPRVATKESPAVQVSKTSTIIFIYAQFTYYFKHINLFTGNSQEKTESG